MALADQVQGAVAGAVVDDDDVDRPGLLAQAVEGGAEVALTVEVRDVDRGADRFSARG
ncbi:MAG: hypothetical protein ABW065_00415 [Solirubrobacterales bacterium]